jgi:hypothetical protein
VAETTMSGLIWPFEIILSKTFLISDEARLKAAVKDLFWENVTVCNPPDFI